MPIKEKEMKLKTKTKLNTKKLNPNPNPPPSQCLHHPCTTAPSPQAQPHARPAAISGHTSLPDPLPPPSKLNKPNTLLTYKDRERGRQIRSTMCIQHPPPPPPGQSSPIPPSSDHSTPGRLLSNPGRAHLQTWLAAKGEGESGREGEGCRGGGGSGRNKQRRLGQWRRLRL